jgi:hypothetical protein
MRQEGRMDRRTDRYTGRHYEVAFRNFAKAPKKSVFPPPLPLTHPFCMCLSDSHNKQQ